MGKGVGGGWGVEQQVNDGCMKVFSDVVSV